LPDMITHVSSNFQVYHSSAESFYLNATHLCELINYHDWNILFILIA